MVLRLCFSLLFLFGCTTLERNNIYDLNGNKEVSSGNFTDSRDNKTYKTVKIGSQIWMAENLNYNVSGSKCYKNESSNCTTYGRLYDWATSKIVCPSGWHLPSDAEWTKLTDYVGGVSTAGSKLKAKSGWKSSGNGTDDYGFSALPGGNGDSDGNFYEAGYSGFWWSSGEVEYDSVSAYIWHMGDGNEYASRFYGSKATLLSVRCVQD